LTRAAPAFGVLVIALLCNPVGAGAQTTVAAAPKVSTPPASTPADGRTAHPLDFKLNKTAKPDPAEEVRKVEPQKTEQEPSSDSPAPAPALPGHVDTVQTSDVIRSTLILTLLALLPAIAICMTPFVRIAIVLSMIRHAFGMPETPPSAVLVTLSLFLTILLMGPTLSAVNDQALQPFLNGSISAQKALEEGSAPMRAFMLRQVHDTDIKTVYDVAHKPLPSSATKVGLMELTTAFMLNELRVAFKIGFVILLPFLLIDLVVSSILLGLGMMMVPPTTLSLPIKVLMFVLIDGWSLVLQGVAGSFR